MWMETIKESLVDFILTRDLRVLIYAIKPIDQRTRFRESVLAVAISPRYLDSRQQDVVQRMIDGKTSDASLRPVKSQTRSLSVRIIVAIFSLSACVCSYESKKNI